MKRLFTKKWCSAIYILKETLKEVTRNKIHLIVLHTMEGLVHNMEML
jgi:hypothetical protein